MREIKFRAWDKQRENMFKVTTIQFPTMFNPGFAGVVKIDGIDTLLPYDTEVIIQQYTGLKDKNGKEIYEGDILAPMGNDFRPEYKGNWEVIFKEGAFFGKATDGYEETWIPYWNPDSEIKVIGNIYENPELLKSEVVK